MTEAIVTTSSPPPSSPSPDQVGLLKRTICKGSTDDELRLFVQTCKRLRLDPFARQVFAVRRWDSQAKREVMSIQVSIDGLRVVAERTGQYRGQTEPEWCGPDGEWRTVWLDCTPPAAARVGVYREGFEGPVYAVARWSTCAQTKRDGSPTKMWSSMPDLMLSKVAESQALRRAFPHDLSGIYSPEEMGSTEVVEADVVASDDLLGTLTTLAEPALLHEWAQSVARLPAGESRPLWEAFRTRCAELNLDPGQTARGEQVAS